MPSDDLPAPEFSGWRLWKSLRCAFRGVLVLLRTEHNARIHFVATVGAVGAGWSLRISRIEWCAVIGAIGLVWMAEGLNTAVEAVVDLVSPEHHPLAGRAKDLAAGAVLCAAIAALAIGLIIFGPRLLALIGA